MSYYGHPFFAQPRGYGHPQPHPHHFPGAHHRHPAPHREPDFFQTLAQLEPRVPHQYGYYADIDEEEAAALAQLRAIRQRRELAQAERERYLRQAKEQEAMLQLAIQEEQRQRQQHEREIMLARAEAERARRHTQMQAIQEQRARELQAFQQQRLQSARAQEVQQENRRCQQRCARPQPPSNGEVNNFRDLMAMLGLRLDEESTDMPTSKPVDTRSPVTQTAGMKVTPGPTPDKVASPGPAAKDTTSASAHATAKPATAETKPQFPEQLNDLLAQYLGLRMEPESEKANDTSSSGKVPAGLNEFLSRFGLEFEPDHPAEAGPSTKAPAPATSSAPVEPTPAIETSSGPAEQAKPTSKEQTPISDFLNGSTNLPPFVRDILGNVELAFNQHRAEKEESKDKGKGVAEGEKKSPAPIPAPAPAPAPVDTVPTSTESLDKLSAIATELNLVKDTFTLPATLCFANTPAEDNTPALLYNRTNKPYHAHSHKLLQLLLAADSITSNGDKEVRAKRREVVRAVEQELEALEKKRDEIWAQVKEQRERGESDDEVEAYSTGSSLVDHEEKHTEEVIDETNSKPNTEADVKPAAEESESHDGSKSTDDEEVKESGYEVVQ